MSTMPASAPYTEPWLRGTHTDVPAAGRAVLHALELALDDVTKWTAGLTDAEVNSQPLGLPSIAFLLRHIAGSTDRILTYAEGNQLSAEQLAALKAEQGSEGNQEPLAELLAEVEASFSNAADRIHVLATANLDTPRARRPQATAHVHRRRAHPRSRSHATPRRPGSHYVQGDQGAPSLTRSRPRSLFPYSSYLTGASSGPGVSRLSLLVAACCIRRYPSRVRM